MVNHRICKPIGMHLPIRLSVGHEVLCLGDVPVRSIELPDIMELSGSHHFWLQRIPSDVCNVHILGHERPLVIALLLASFLAPELLVTHCLAVEDDPQRRSPIPGDDLASGHGLLPAPSVAAERRLTGVVSSASYLHGEVHHGDWDPPRRLGVPRTCAEDGA